MTSDYAPGRPHQNALLPQDGSTVKAKKFFHQNIVHVMTENVDGDMDGDIVGIMLGNIQGDMIGDIRGIMNGTVFGDRKGKAYGNVGNQITFSR